MSHNSNAVGVIDWTSQLEQHSPWLRKVLRSRIGDRHEVDDLLQEIALAVFRQSARPDDPERVAPWLYRLAIRQSINFHRKLGRKSYARPDSELEVTDHGNEPLDGLLAVEQKEAMRMAIDALAPRDREILILKYTENWNYRQLAAHLGVKTKTVEYRLMRARKSLRHLVTQNTNSDSRPNVTQPIAKSIDENKHELY